MAAKRTWNALSRLDGWANRLYGSRYNPLYHSGTIAVASLVVLLVTGVYLLLFYRVGDPWGSVARITDQAWAGRWIRSLHRYASDVALVAVGVHALRMFAQGRSWGPRALAWLSGLVLLGVFFVCGWTGYVMVWDGQALALAREGARIADALPLFAEPISRAFTGERALPGAFFFLNLFLHIALPVGMALLLWVHVSRVTRPVLLPPKALRNGLLLMVLAISVLWPVGAGEPADLGRLTGTVSLDVFYSFWLPVTRTMPAWSVWLAAAALILVPATVPLWTRPAPDRRPEPSVVDEGLCTGCTQCMLDCPYEAIQMVVRTGDEAGLRSDLVARVSPDLCVSCGICAGSCAPMGVGPPGRTGRDQVAEVRRFLEEHRPGAGDVILVGCGRSAASADAARRLGVLLFPVTCAGNLHTSSIELLVRGGAGGVFVVSCPGRDCWNREGVKWLGARVHDGREAELKERVDRTRVRLFEAAAGQERELGGALERFRRDVRALRVDHGDDDLDLDTECEPALDREAALAWRDR